MLKLQKREGYHNDVFLPLAYYLASSDLQLYSQLKLSYFAS